MLVSPNFISFYQYYMSAYSNTIKYLLIIQCLNLKARTSLIVVGTSHWIYLYLDTQRKWGQWLLFVSNTAQDMGTFTGRVAKALAWKMCSKYCVSYFSVDLFCFPVMHKPFSYLDRIFEIFVYNSQQNIRYNIPNLGGFAVSFSKSKQVNKNHCYLNIQKSLIHWYMV